MALKDGHHKTKRKEGTRNCFFCLHDIKEWVTLTWPQIKELYDHCGVHCPIALCCKKCHEQKPNEELYRIFWATLMVLECKKFKEGKPTIIKDKMIYNQFLDEIKKNKHLVQKDVDEGL